MGKQKPNKPSKSPNKLTEEQDKQDPSTNITPQPAAARKNTTETEQSENPQTKPYRAHPPPSKTFTQTMHQCYTIWTSSTEIENLKDKLCTETTKNPSEQWTNSNT
jgi:hypothetical protein